MRQATLRLAAILLIAAAPAFGQATVTTKPIFSTWQVGEITGVEVRLWGRLLTEPVGNSRLLVVIPLKSWDWLSVLTFRITTLVPTGETWEVQRVSYVLTPALGTNLEPFEIKCKPFDPFYVAPSGRTLAIDVDPRTGVTVAGPFGSTIPTGLRLVN